MPTITDPLKLAATIEDAASLILRWGHAQMRQLPAAEIEMIVAALRGSGTQEPVAWMDKTGCNFLMQETKVRWEKEGWHQDILPRYTIPVYAQRPQLGEGSK